VARILHFADLHLDSSFASVGMTSSEATRRRDELRAALRRIVDLALERHVDAVTVGGDLYEHDRATLDTGRFLMSQFERLAPRPVLIAPGNHDRCVPDGLYRQLDWPDNVHIFYGMDWQAVTVADGIAVWGVGHNGPSVRQNLLRELHLDPSRPAVALLHGSDTAAVPEGKAAHCPFEAGDADRCGAAFVLLGHYHRMRLWPAASPRCGYPGSPEPLGFDEGGPHYVLLLTVGEGPAAVEPVRINEVSYRTERVDVAGMSTSDQVREAIVSLSGDGSPSPDIVRVLLEGQAEPHLDLGGEALLSATADRFRYLDIVDQTHPAFELDELAEEATTRGAFVRLMRGRIEVAAGPELEKLENALRYGLQAFAKLEVRPR
jgi:DNA repair exonuclease SbcCD nuclease subunit